MVLRVRQAMIVPQSVQGGANGCHVATHLGSNRDLGMQCTGMDKTKGGIENGNMIAGWHRAASESSMSSLDSLAPGEPIYSQSDIPPSAYHRRARLGLHASESDDEPMTDSMQEDLVNRKFRRPLGGGGTVPLSHLAAHPAADEVAADHGYNPSDDGKDCASRVKFMCSFGGKIFPRPLDGKLRYVGGDTKIISVSRDTNFVELMAKMTDVYGQAPTLKYQLPDEDLDALVSVSSDEDLENMLEEYDRLVRADVSSKLRVFLFPAVDYDSSSSLHLKESTADSRNSEQRYVDAVNGIPEAGPRIRMENFGNNAPIFPTENLIGVDVPEAWNFQARGQDAVPGPLVSPPIAHDVVSQNLRLTAATSGSGLSSKPTAPSAPSSAPSSPPLLPRTAPLGKPFVGADLHLPYHHDTHGKVVPQYKEGNYQESENHGGSAASSAASQHDSLYRSSESWRPPDSPPRKPPHDVGHPVDYALRMEQQRRLSEPKMSRVGSHGKLSRLADHGELASEAQEKLETQRLIQEKALHQVVWQHPLDPQPDGFRRLDMIQPSSAQATAGLGQPQQGYQQQGYQPQPQPQQHQHVKYRGGHPPGKLLGHEGGYRQGDQQQQYAEEVLHHLPRVVSSHAMPAVSGQSNTYPVGSDPSSPRLGFRDAPSSKHVPGSQQLPLHWAYSGAAFAEQPAYGRRKPTVDQPGRSYRVSNSPPKYRDHLIHNDERLHRQQQGLGSSESLHHDQVPKSAQIFYETGSAGQPYDLLSRPHIPQYKGLNPFQEKIVPYQDHQESGDGRRHQLSIQGKDSQGLTVHQPQHLHPLHQNQRLDYHDPLPHQGDQLSVNSRYQEPLKIAEWDSEDARLAFRGRPRAVAADDDRHVDSGTSHEREMHQASYSGLHLPETSEDLLSGQVADFPPVHGNNERLDHSGNGFPFRPTVLPPAAGLYSNPKPRSAHSDNLGIPRYVSRPNESDYLAGGMRTAGSNLDPRPSIFEVNGQQQVVQPPSGPHRLDERTAAFNPVTQQLKTLRLGDNVMMGNDIRWNGGLGPDDVRIEVANQGPSRDNMGAYYEDRHQGLPNVPVSRGRLSRPSSSSNIAGLVDDERGDNAHLLPYGTTQGRNGLLMDEDVVIHQYPGQSHSSTENLLYISNPTRPAKPTPPVNSVPYAAGKLSFDRSPPGSTSADFLATMDDLPAIKTIATQVPSIEGDNSGGSTSTVGGSYQNLSNKGSGELCMGQMAMAQHLAEDVASCVLDTSPVKMDSDPGMVPCDTVAAQGTTGWPRERPPSSSPNPWENALDDAVATKNEDINDTSLAADENSDSTPVEAASSTSKQEDHEDAKVSTTEVDKDKGKVKNAADVAAADAIAHGLQTIKNDDLEELRELGSGTFGTVYHGKWRGTDVAIKRIKASCFAGRPSEQERLVADFWREACNLGHLHHPNVVAFYGVVSDGPGGTLATVTEYMVNGSLKQVLQKKDRTIDRRKRLLIAMDSAFGMEYLHGKNIVHFDLKCENLLVNMRDPHRPICKVGDLGLSKVKHQTMVSGGVRGTLPWMAPELLDGSSSLVTEKVDVFSFGIVMWELLTGEEPYANMHYGAIIGGIVNHTLRPPIPTWCDPGWRSLMERCWSSDTNARPSFSVIASELRAMSEGLKLKPQPPPVQA